MIEDHDRTTQISSTLTSTSEDAIPDNVCLNLLGSITTTSHCRTAEVDAVDTGRVHRDDRVPFDRNTCIASQDSTTELDSVDCVSDGRYLGARR